MSAPPPPSSEIVTQLAHHDAAISNLGGRVGGLEAKVQGLQNEVHSGFATLNSKLDKLDARPAFDFHQTVSTVTTIAVLFSMVVGGIIWITTGQFAGALADQKGINSSVAEKLRQHDDAIAKMQERVGWAARVEPRKP